MFRDKPTDVPAAPDASGTGHRRNRSEGHVVSCDGTHAVITALMPGAEDESPDYWAVGSLITIRTGAVRTVGMLYKVEVPEGGWTDGARNQIHIHVELVGEILENAAGKPVFIGGMSVYPHLGAVAHRIRNADLAAIFANTDKSAVRIGCLSQNREIDAMLSIDALVSRHFAVVGTTGVGKSTSVSLLVRKIVEKRPDIGILILDPHNEFAKAFPDISITVTDGDLDLPFWIFRLEEFVEVLFRGRPPIPEEVDILRDLIPIARTRFNGDQGAGLRKSRGGNSVTADTPIPYRIADLLALVEERIGKLDGRDERPFLKALAARINAAINDPRYRFMFANKTIEDNLAEVLARIFRVPSDGRPVTTFQLNGIPSEVVNAVVSVLCRLAFELSVWSHSRIKTLVLCEEAHRYIPANKEAGFGPTRAAIARIAKEGRKYGVSLGIITQRPADLDETILSQCNTFFAMRLGNDADQDIMRKAISGASRSYINFLPSLANREAIAFGQGVTTPMRMMFQTVAEQALPGSAVYDDEANAADSTVDLAEVLNAIRVPHAADREDEVHVEPERIVGEQRPSLERAMPQPAGYFDYDGPLRRVSDRPASGIDLRAGRRLQDPVAREEEPRVSARDLVNRFRK